MTIPAKIASKLEDVLRLHMRSDDSVLSVLAAGYGRHLDTDSLAAFIDGEGDLQTAGHLLRCSSCRERASSVAAICNVEPIEVPALVPRTSFLLRGQSAHLPSAFATLHVGSSACWIESKYASSKQHSVLQVRGVDSDAIVIRDAIDEPSFETRILLSTDRSRFDLHVRWLDASTAPDAIRVEQAARIVVSAPLRDSVAVVPSLRARDSTLWFEQKSAPLGQLTLFVESEDA